MGRVKAVGKASGRAAEGRPPAARPPAARPPAAPKKEAKGAAVSAVEKSLKGKGPVPEATLRASVTRTLHDAFAGLSAYQSGVLILPDDEGVQKPPHPPLRCSLLQALPGLTPQVPWSMRIQPPLGYQNNPSVATAGTGRMTRPRLGDGTHLSRTRVSLSLPRAT